MAGESIALPAISLLDKLLGSDELLLPSHELVNLIAKDGTSFKAIKSLSFETRPHTRPSHRYFIGLQSNCALRAMAATR